MDEKNDSKVAQDMEQFAMDDYDSDREGKPSSGKDNTNSLSAETLALMDKLGMSGNASKDEEEEQEDEVKVLKFVLCLLVINDYRSFFVPEPIHN